MITISHKVHDIVAMLVQTFKTKIIEAMHISTNHYS